MHSNAAVAERLGGAPVTIEARGMAFDGFRADPEEATGAPVVLVHGWPEFAACWDRIAAELLAAGHPILAYDQRGYSPGARPEPVEAYTVAELVADLIAVADAAGIERFHLVGHDWGGVMGWAVAAEHADRLLSFTSLASAHTTAHGERMKADPEQWEHMEYMRKIRDHREQVCASMLRDGGRKLAELYGGAVPQPVVDSYLRRFAEPGLLDAALKYYCALGMGEQPALTPITVPTLYIWGSEDVAFTRGAAELTGDYVDGPYRFVELPGASHWLPEEMPEACARAIVPWLAAHDG